MNHFYILGFLLSLLIFYGCGTSQENPEEGPMNILFIAVDDLRPELACYGASHIHSPAIDQLASEGLLFERAYCNVPVCGASRASLLSGLRPGRHRFLSYSTLLDQDAPGIVSLPRHFRQHGYKTISYGKVYHHAQDDSAAWHESWRPEATNHSGWRDYHSEENLALHHSSDSRGLPYENIAVPDEAYFDGKIAAKGIAQLKELKKQDQPFFLAIGFAKPHLPFNAPTRYWDLYERDSLSLPSNYQQPETTPQEAFHNFGELRHYAHIPQEGPLSEEMAKTLIHGYYACVSYVDAQIGKVLAELKALELDKNTLVILWGDHGWNLGDHQLWCKHCNFESSLHVPMILRVPGQAPALRSEAIVEFIDIYPSLCEWAGLPLPAHLEGESFLSELEGGGKRQKNYAVAKFYNGVTLVEDQLFYTEWLNEQDDTQAQMLFDHMADPLELENLVDKLPPTEVAQLKEKLHDRWGKDFFTKPSPSNH